MRKLLFLIGTLLVFYVLHACGQEAQYEDYEMDSSYLILTRNNHPHGYGQKECFTCHVYYNIHKGNCFDCATMEFARKIKVKSEDVNICVGCHGDNGVVL